MDWNALLDDAPRSAPVGMPLSAELAEPYDLTPIRLKLAPYENELARMKAEAEDLKIIDEASAEQATSLGARCQKIEKAVEEARKFFKAPALAFGKEIDAFAAAFTDKAQAAKRTLSGKVGAWQRKKDEEARELLRKQQEEARRLQAQADAEAARLGTDAPAVIVPREAPAPATIRTTAGKATMVKRWVCRVKEPGLVPRDYCEVSQTLLNKAVTAGIREIPGCEIVEEASARFGA